MEAKRHILPSHPCVVLTFSKALYYTKRCCGQIKETKGKKNSFLFQIYDCFRRQINTRARLGRVNVDKTTTCIILYMANFSCTFLMAITLRRLLKTFSPSCSCLITVNKIKSSFRIPHRHSILPQKMRKRCDFLKS